jgi:AraC family transcriptional regulator
VAHVRTLCAQPQLSIHDITCAAARGGPGAARGGESTHLVFVRRGVFLAHVGTRAYVADPRTAIVSWGDTEYRVSHPGACGDDCTVLDLSPALADELLRGRRARIDVEVPLAPATQAHYARALAIAERGDAFAAEEAALELARATLGDPARAVGTPSRRRSIVRRARELLDADPTSACSVATLAAAVGVSPYHLMRLFRHETGTTLRAYRVQLRLALALHRLRRGERDLAALAVELGFASHAHLTDTFTRLLGTSPRSFRTQLAP